MHLYWDSIGNGVLKMHQRVIIVCEWWMATESLRNAINSMSAFEIERKRTRSEYIVLSENGTNFMESNRTNETMKTEPKLKHWAKTAEKRKKHRKSQRHKHYTHSQRKIKTREQRRIEAMNLCAHSCFFFSFDRHNISNSSCYLLRNCTRWSFMFSNK